MVSSSERMGFGVWGGGGCGGGGGGLRWFQLLHWQRERERERGGGGIEVKFWFGRRREKRTKGQVGREMSGC